MRHLIPLLLATVSTMPLAAEACGVDPHRPMLGVEMSPVPSGVQQQQGLGNDQGVLVRQTFGGTAADAMGVKSGDVILSVNGAAIGSMTDLRNEVGGQNVGDPVSVVVRRNGQDLALASTIKEWPKSIPYDPIDAEAERRFRDWQQRRLGRQRDDLSSLARQAEQLKKDQEAAAAPSFIQSDALRQAELALRFLPPWTLSYEWDTAEIPAAPGVTVPAAPASGDPWLAVAVMSTRFVEL